MATNMYLFLVYLVNLIGPTKSKPHSMNGSFGRVITCLAKLCVANRLVCWHTSHDLQKSLTSLYIVGHYYLASKIFFYVISSAKCLPIVPSCNSFITFWAFVVDKHLLNLLSYPILYKHHFSFVKGLALLASCSFCPIDKYSSICLIYI